MTVQRVRVVFAGRVQGVGFRATARAAARAHPVSGWVRNEADGTVTMEVQGTPEHIEHCLDDLRRRMASNIRSEMSSVISSVSDEHGFEIRR